MAAGRTALCSATATIRAGCAFTRLQGHGQPEREMHSDRSKPTCGAFTEESRQWSVLSTPQCTPVPLTWLPNWADAAVWAQAVLEGTHSRSLQHCTSTAGGPQQPSSIPSPHRALAQPPRCPHSNPLDPTDSELRGSMLSLQQGAPCSPTERLLPLERTSLVLLIEREILEGPQ